MMLNPHQLMIFQTVASEGSISRAADVLYLTQPAISQHIKSLERELGVTLFVRGRKGMALTKAGEVLLDYTQQLLQLSQEARQAVKQAAMTEKRHMENVHLGATPGVGSCLLPRWSKLFYRQHSMVSLSVKIASTPNLVHLVAGHQLAFAIIGDHLQKSLIEVTPLWDEEAVIVVGREHRWWGRPFIRAEELMGETFVMREESSLARAWEMQSLAEFGVLPQAVVEFTAPSAIKQAVIANMGIALLPCFSVQQEVSLGQLYAVRLREGTLSRTFRLLWTPVSLKSPGVTTLLRFLLSHADELAFHPLQSPKRQVQETFQQSPLLAQTLIETTDAPLLTP